MTLTNLFDVQREICARLKDIDVVTVAWTSPGWGRKENGVQTTLLVQFRVTDDQLVFCWPDDGSSYVGMWGDTLPEWWDDGDEIAVLDA